MAHQRNLSLAEKACDISKKKLSLLKNKKQCQQMFALLTVTVFSKLYKTSVDDCFWVY